jgi:hypothetical protein
MSLLVINGLTLRVGGRVLLDRADLSVELRNRRAAQSRWLISGACGGQ